MFTFLKSRLDSVTEPESTFFNTCHFEYMSKIISQNNKPENQPKLTIVKNQCLFLFGAMLLPKLKDLFGLSRKDRVDTGSSLLEQVLAHDKRLFITEDIEQLKIAFKYESQLVTETEKLETSYLNHV